VTGKKKKTFQLPPLRNNKQHSSLRMNLQKVANLSFLCYYYCYYFAVCLLFFKLTKGRFAIREERAPLVCVCVVAFFWGGAGGCSVET